MNTNKTIEKLADEFSKWNMHQLGCAYRKKGKWIMLPCDMNCRNVFEGKLSLALPAIKNAIYEESVRLLQEHFDNNISPEVEYQQGVFDSLHIVKSLLKPKE